MSKTYKPLQQNNVMEDACPICCRDFTDVQRTRIECPYCHKGLCSSCFQRVLLNDSDAFCVFCKGPLSDAFVDAHVSKTFRFGPLKDHRKGLLLDRERSLIPASTALVERELSLRERRKALGQWMAQKEDLERQVHALNNAIRKATQEMHASKKGPPPPDAARLFVHPCPARDCRGYVSSDTWTCGVCQTPVCKHCHEERSVNHECSPEALESVRSIQKETRACPSCNVRIYKIDGCNQMFCTQCHTAFSWTTGARIDHGQVHNPHYYEWMRSRGTPPCQNEELTYWNVRHHLRTTYSLELPYFFECVHRIMTHVRYEDLQVAPGDTDPFRPNADLRVAFMLKEMDEASFRNEVFRRDKALRKQRALHDLFRMFVDACGDLFQKLHQQVRTREEMEAVQDECEALRVYVNQCSRDISQRFGSSVYKGISEAFRRVERFKC